MPIQRQNLTEHNKTCCFVLYRIGNHHGEWMYQNQFFWVATAWNLGTKLELEITILTPKLIRHSNFKTIFQFNWQGYQILRYERKKIDDMKIWRKYRRWIMRQLQGTVFSGNTKGNVSLLKRISLCGFELFCVFHRRVLETNFSVFTIADCRKLSFIYGWWKTIIIEWFSFENNF